MKKILLIPLILIFLTACKESNNDDPIIDDDPVVDQDPIDDEDPIVEDPIIVNDPIELAFSYNLSTNLDLDITLSNDVIVESVFSEALAFDNTSYTYQDGIISIGNEYLKTLSDGFIEVLLTSENDTYNIEIEIIDDRIPQLASENEVIFQSGTNINLVFELYGGSVVQLNGNNISEIDYTIDGNSVIINTSFIDELLVSDPLRERVIISYYLENKGFITIGYLFIETN